MTLLVMCMYVLVLCVCLTPSPAFIITPTATNRYARFWRPRTTSSSVPTSSTLIRREAQSKKVVESPKKEVVEFSRIVNVAQIPKKKAILCRLLAKPEELQAIGKRLKLPELTRFSANMTLSWKDSQSIAIQGSFAAHFQSTTVNVEAESAEDNGTNTVDDADGLLSGVLDGATDDEMPSTGSGGAMMSNVEGDIETLLLCNVDNPTPIDFDDAEDFDDEVDASGNIDIGEIATQYLAMELW